MEEEKAAGLELHVRVRAGETAGAAEGPPHDPPEGTQGARRQTVRAEETAGAAGGPSHAQGGHLAWRQAGGALGNGAPGASPSPAAAAG